MPRLVPAALLAALLVVHATALGADEEDPLRRVSFQVDRSRDVENDWATASMAITDEDPSPKALAQRINQTMSWALERARGATEVEVKTGGYTTSPVYDKNRIVRWRASQQLWLESAEVERLTELMGGLQERLQVESVSFSVSPELRRKVEDELIREALAAYRERAELVRESLGSSRYTLVALGLNTQGGPEPRPLYRSGAMAEQAMAPPALEGGTSALVVSVNATIELE